MIGSPTGYSAQAQNAVERLRARVERRLRTKCGGRTPSGFEQFSTEIRPAVTADRFGDRQVDRVLRAWLRWSSKVGVPEAASREIRNLAYCRREFLPKIDASYRIWWKWTETGKAWWIDITFDNRTGKPQGGSVAGRAVATKMLEDPFGWTPGPEPGQGRDAHLGWGGSSADFVGLARGRSVTRVAPDADQDVHTTADGTFRVTEVEVDLQPAGRRHWCSVPVRSR